MTKITLLVGMHFRPPAKILLANLPVGSTLYLRPEPDNPYDENAIAVFLRTEDFVELFNGDSEEQRFVDGELEGMGHSLESLQDQDEWHLGYVAATDGKPLLKAKAQGGLGEADYVGNTDILPLIGDDTLTATLQFDAVGNPLLFIGE